MNNKAAIEISAAFLVSTIVALVFFSLALYFGLNMMKGAEEYSIKLNDQAVAQAENMLDSGHDSVVMPFKQKRTIKDDMTLFALGIRNVVDDLTKPARAYKIIVAYNEEKSTQACGNCDVNWIKMNSGSGKSPLATTVEPRRNRVVSIGVFPPANAADGTYAFDVSVCYDDAVASNNPPNCDAGLKDFYTETLLIKAIVKS